MWDARQVWRFGDFQVDPVAYTLLRRGRPVRLEHQPMELLILLLERCGELVSRNDIISRLWPPDVFIDYDTAVSTAVRKLRLALRDSAQSPRFIATVAGKGYRFIAPVQVGASERSNLIRLAVLPIETLSAEPGHEFLADGLTEELIALFGQLDPQHLTTIGRTSVTAYKRSGKTLSTIGKELRVNYVLEGSVRVEGRRVRLTTRLVHVHDQTQVWSASYDRDAEGVLTVQQELCATIAKHVKLKLSPERLMHLSRRQTRNPEAYNFYLTGRQLWHQLTPATTGMAIDSFRRATQLDPGYALPWAAIAEAYASSAINGDAPPLQVWKLADEAARRSQRADSTLAEAHHVLGQINFFFGWDWPQAESSYREAIALNPGLGFPHVMLGHLLSQSGRHEEAKDEMAWACDLDPLSSLVHALVSQVAFQRHDYAAALHSAQHAIALNPDFWVGHMMRGQACERCDDFHAAIEAFTRAEYLSDNSKPISARAFCLASRGRTEEARGVLEQLRERAQNRYVPPYALALIHAGLQQPSAAFEALERAYAARDVHLIFLTVDPKWDAYRDCSEFRSLLERCNFTAAGAPRSTRSRLMRWSAAK